MIVDKNGFLIAVMVTVANIHDSKTGYLLMRMLKELSSSVKTIIADEDTEENWRKILEIPLVIYYKW